MDSYSDVMTEDDPSAEAQSRPDADPQERLRQFAQAQGDISELLTPSEIADLGKKVVEDFEYDWNSNTTWRETAKRALDAAAQDQPEGKSYPWDGASNVKFPTLTVAATQFAARAYPAVIKGDVAMGVKVLGKKPAPQQMQPGQQASPQQQAWDKKKARAERVKDWLNYRLFYGMPDWEADVDVMLNQLPIIGMGFKKVYKSPRYGVCSEYVSALHVTVHCDTKSLDDCPRITHDYELYPYQIKAGIHRGDYIDIADELHSDNEDDQAPRTILEQHRMHDIDGDGVEEPYIITVDKESQRLLKIEAAYNEADVILQGNTIVDFIRFNPFIAFPFMPDPKGRFYGIGFGHLLEQISEAINSGINQLLDAGHAQNAGGGFISSGLRIQGGGQTSSLKFKPSEYKVVNSPGGDLRQQIYERTVPQPSPVLFGMLGMLIDAGRDIASVKDVLTGDAPTNAPVGTTMAIIEQGLAAFNAIYKRFYRSEKAEFKLIFECERKWGGADARQAYADFFDGDPEANFDADFDPKGYDVVPISDPTVVTKAQQLAKAQYMQQFIPLPFANGPEIMKRALEAADIDDPEELIVIPQGPNPMEKAELAKTESEANKNNAQAVKAVAEAGATTGEHEATGAFHAGVHAESGGLSGLGGEPGDAVGNEVAGQGGGIPTGSVEQPDMGSATEPEQLNSGAGPEDGSVGA